METNYKGMNVVRDLPGQVEFNRRKNVEQDQRLSTLSSQVADLLAQEPAGYLPEVFYGITTGEQTYRFQLDYQFIVDNLDGSIGDSYEIYDESQSEAYIPAIAVQIDETKLKIIIKGDYPAYGQTLKVVNMKTGDDYEVTLIGAMLLQDASYLGAFDADDYKNKQITVLHDLETNKDNVLFCSIDLNSDGNYNWISIGSFTNGADGKCVYSINNTNMSAVLSSVKAEDSLVLCENLSIGQSSYLLGDILLVDSINPLTLTKLGNIRGPQGETGATGATGADGEDGETPEIVNGYWYIGGVSTGVKAVGTDGTNGQNGQSFQTQSGLYSVPDNEGQTGNVDPDGNALLTLPTLPTTGITGKGYVVFDPLTTPLQPYYDLYWANDGDTTWTIIHPFSGINGQDGTDGQTPYIGQNGHWYIGSTDTGVDATGPQGPAGPAGIVDYEGTQESPIILSSIIENHSIGDLFRIKGYFKFGTNGGVYNSSEYMLCYYYYKSASTTISEPYTIAVIGPRFVGGGTINKTNEMHIKLLTFGTSTYWAGSIKDYNLYGAVEAYQKSSSTVTALTTTNTSSYTPTADYHPATKKYVDDAVAGAGGASLYRHNLYLIGTNSYFGIWCDIVNTSSAEITTIAEFTTALYNAGYTSAQGSYNRGELNCSGWYTNGTTYHNLLSISSTNGTSLKFKFLLALSGNNSSTLFGFGVDTGPVIQKIEDHVVQIS